MEDINVYCNVLSGGGVEDFVEPIGVATHWLDECTFHIQFISFKLVLTVFLSGTMKDVFIEHNGGHRIANRHAHVLNLSINVGKES